MCIDWWVKLVIDNGVVVKIVIENLKMYMGLSELFKNRLLVLFYI